MVTLVVFAGQGLYRDTCTNSYKVATSACSSKYLQKNFSRQPKVTSSIFSGQDLYRQLQGAAESGFQSSFTQDHTGMLRQIQRTMEYLSSRLDQVQELWRDKEWQVSGRMQVSELEQGMSTVSELVTISGHFVLFYVSFRSIYLYILL